MGIYPGSAKVCVEIDVSISKPPKIHLRLGTRDLWLPCSYEDHPPFCSKCLRFGHQLSHCRKLSSQAELLGPSGAGGSKQEWKMVMRKVPKPSHDLRRKAPTPGKHLQNPVLFNPPQIPQSKSSSGTEQPTTSLDVGVDTVPVRLSKGKAKATSDGSTSRGHGSRGRHSVSSFPTVPDHLIGDAMTDEEFNQIYSGRGDANLPTLDSLFEDVDEAGLDNLHGDDEPTPQSNDVDVEAGEPETSRGPDKDKNSYYYSYLVEWKNERDNAITLFEDLFKEYQGLYGTVQEETAPPPPLKSKKGFSGIVGGLLAKKGKRAQSSTSSSGTTVSSHNELAMYQGVPCDYDDDDVDFDVLGWWKRNEHMFPCLGMLARQVLSVPVSTVAVEREFSAGGNILTDYRSCLNAKSLETLVCNQDWLLARRRAQESSYQLESEHYMNATTDGSPNTPASDSPLQEPSSFSSPKNYPFTSTKTLGPHSPPFTFPPDLSFLYPFVQNQCKEIIPFKPTQCQPPLSGSKDDLHISPISWEPEDEEDEIISPVGYHSDGGPVIAQETPITPHQVDISLCSKVSMPLQRPEHFTGYATRSKTRKDVPPNLPS
ncbi:hypothetical protein DM860_014847 [Cuscuta australis]|uniref:HAT C-terminal dimerisation domain-containing protein n=1 Tax=Cuscuta australis TaxID=267555 RepID=A0A328DLD7_9ASTE|nr:hypothetical protein DM860_014847 [Cuscuta australis]